MTIGGVLRFDLSGVGVGVVEASPPLSDALFPVRRQAGGITTRVALHNLESSPGLVRCDWCPAIMREWAMQRKRGEVVPIREVFGGLDGPVKAIHDKASDKRTVLNFGATPLLGCGGRRITN